MNELSKFIISISHPWLSFVHADPQGVHLKIALERLRVRLFPVGWHLGLLASGVNLWRQYYYFCSDGDVLIFFDHGSLAQAPRTTEEQSLFEQALKHVRFTLKGNHRVSKDFDIIFQIYISRNKWPSNEGGGYHIISMNFQRLT